MEEDSFYPIRHSPTVAPNRELHVTCPAWPSQSSLGRFIDILVLLGNSSMGWPSSPALHLLLEVVEALSQLVYLGLLALQVWAVLLEVTGQQT